jgi:hypothetical protein
MGGSAIIDSKRKMGVFSLFGFVATTVDSLDTGVLPLVVEVSAEELELVDEVLVATTDDADVGHG